MRREELVMEIIGGLDDRFITEAMPSHGSQKRAADTRAVAAVTPVEDIGKISKKDRVIYWVTHSLGVAAAAILIIGAAVLLIINWDKIAVREPDRPGTIVNDTNGLPDISEAFGKLIKFTDADVRLSKVIYDGVRLHATFHILYHGSDEFYSPSLWINVEGVTYSGIQCAVEPVTEADSYDHIVYSFIDVGLESGSSYVVNVEYKSSGNRESDTRKYSFTCPNVTAVTTAGTTNDPYLTTTVEALIEPDTADPFGQITDTSMPEPFAPAETNWGARDFFAQWDRKFGDHNSAAEIYLTELSGYETDHGGEQGELYPADTTPYTLDDSANDYNHARIMGLEGDALADLIRKRNETYSKNLGMADYIYSEDEIKLLISGSRSEIIDRFRSEFSIVVGEYVFSPRWLYYHTAEDYQSAGIIRQMIGKMLKKYEGLGLTDEAWKAFREKLILYYTYGVFDEASVDKTYIIDTENCKLSGDSAFEILEKVYYGEWEIKEPFEPYKSVLSLTYQQDPFANGMIPVTGMFETDEIYALAFTNGGAAGCLLIEKSAPDVMYWTDILPSGVGLDVVKFGYGFPGTYINRKTAVPEIKSGELSSLGLKKLFHTYGKAFEDSFAKTLEKDRSAGIETGMGTAYAASKDIRFGELPGYLADYTDDSINMLLPYYCEKDGDVTTFYAVKSFMKNYNGEWDAVDIWTDESIFCPIGEETPDWGITMSAKDVTPTGMTLVIDQKGGNAANVIEYGSRYRIEIKSDENGAWEMLPYITNKVAWTLDASIVDPGSHIEEKVNWSYIYGYLSAGHYRLVKIFREDVDGKADQIEVNCEFDITADTPE